MSANILGLSAHYHDSAACLYREGRPVAAAQEERFTRRKNDSGFPSRAVDYCLQAGGITAFDVDAAVFYEKPFLKFSRVLEGHLASFPRSLKSFMRAMPLWLEDRLAIPLVLRERLGYEGKVLFLRHHLSHAASAFLPSPFEEAAVLTADAVGERASVGRGVGRGGKVALTREIRFPDSLGLLYTAVTCHLGFEAHEGEGKVMALAGRGKPSMLDRFRESVQVRDDGSFRLDRSFFDFYGADRMVTPRFLSAFGPAREPGGELTQRHRDLAASLQAFTEDVVLKTARDLHRETRLPDLCLAGGVFLNCVVNHRILEDTPFKRVFIQPAAGDAGGALGAAAYVSHCLLGLPRGGSMDPLLGPESSPAESRAALVREGLPFRELPDAGLFSETARRLAEGKTVGWFQGRMEFGPRALGNRSILGDPRNPDIKRILNERVKDREPFRPYAPAVLAEAAREFFDLRDQSPHMLLAPKARPERARAIPGVVHDDGTARVQTVTQESNPRFRALIKAFESLTGVPMVVNTSFNLRGEPVVCSPADAVSVFRRSRMDCLALGNFLVDR